MSVGRGRTRAVRSRPTGSEWEWLAADLRRGPTNVDCFDPDGESKGVGLDGVRWQVPAGAEPGSAWPSLDIRAVEADCS
jgi:hypothetical protein